MLWKGVKVPGFVRFSGLFKTAMIAVVFAFGVSNAHAATCSAGKSQDQVFSAVQVCGETSGSFGYEHTGNASLNSPISTGDGTWMAYFPSFRVKGKAFCSTTAPTTSTQVGTCNIVRRPTATNIDTGNGGNYCWCQATEHQQFSTISNTWAAPYQKIYAKYVYLKDMGTDCANSCAAYCSYMQTNMVLDSSLDNPATAKELRASIYDSLLDCVPEENKLTYYNDDEVIDYQYYNAGSVTLKSDMVKTDFSFKGWCVNSKTCTSPLAAGSIQNGWSGERKLYAQWEREKCGAGVVSEIQDGKLYCTTECKDGYEKQFNPFSAQYDEYVSDELNYCKRPGNGPAAEGDKWVGSFSGYSYMVKGYGYCSATEPILTDLATDSACHTILHPTLEEIDMNSTGSYCWCKATEYQRLKANKDIKEGTHPLDARYVYAGNLYNCEADCRGRCADMAMHPDGSLPNLFVRAGSESLRVSIFRSLRQCTPGHYTLKYQSDGYILNTIENYTVTDIIELPTPPTPPEKSGFVFVGWCKDLDNCPEPMTQTVTGLSGNITLYAKWKRAESQITYVSNGADIPQMAPTVYSSESPAVMVASESTQWFDNPYFEGEPITTLPNEDHQFGDIILYAEQMAVGPTPDEGGSEEPAEAPGDDENPVYPPNTSVNCGAGYESNTASLAVLNSTIDTKTAYSAYRSTDGQSRLIYALLPGVTDDANSNGKWGLLFPKTAGAKITTTNDSLFGIYGIASCNVRNGETPPDNMLYSELDNQTMLETDTGGGHCWCKMTDFTVTGYSNINSASSPWVYLKSFSDATGSAGCTRNCALECVSKMKSSAFFRAQVFGEYSACKIDTFNISYELNGGEFDAGTIAPTEYTLEYKTLTIPNTLSKEHHTFNAWCENAALTKNCSKAKTIPTGSSGDRIFYAKWDQIRYNIEYNLPSDAKWLTNSTHPDTYTFGSTISISLPTRDSYDFIGWCVGTQDNCTDDQLQTDYSITPDMSGTVVLWPHWRAAEFSIVYQTMDGQEISGLMPDKYTFGVEVNLPDDVSIPNYDFVAWHVRQNLYSPTIETIPVGTSGIQVFYAEMAATKYDITYHDGDTTFTDDMAANYNLPTQYTYDIETSLPGISKQHYDFVGWYDNAELTGDAIETIPAGATGAKEFWAKWTLTPYTITYYRSTNTADGVFRQDTYTIETPNITPLPTLDDSEYFRWDGWIDEKGDPITEIITSTGGDREIYGTWTRTSCEKDFYLVDGACVACPGNYPFSFNQNSTLGGCFAICLADNKNCPEHSDICEYDSLVVTDDEIGTNINYYQADRDPCQIVFDCQTNYHKSDIKCEPDVFNITYHDGDSIIDADYFDLPKTYTYSQTTQLPNNIIKPQYTFVAWHRDPDLSDYPVTEISDTDSGDQDFYAEWTAATYYVKYNHGVAGSRTDGFSGTMPTQSVAFGEDVTLVANAFSIYGYTFKNWSCSVTIGSGESYNETYQDGENIGEYDFAGSMTCTANWTANKYKLNYDCGDGELANRTVVNVTYDAPYTLDASVCKPRTNYSITYWECTNNLDTQNNLWNIEDDSTCVAHWADNVYRIEYRESNGTLINTVTPTTYTAAADVTIPDTNPTREHYRFAGWCDNTRLNLNCSLQRTIPAGTNTNPKVFYAKWAATECPEGQYLDQDSEVCKNCPNGYTSDAWSATHQDQCYFDWECIDECPDGADCEFVGGAQSGRIYWGQDEDYSCDINIYCHRGYIYDDTSDKPYCMLNYYTVHYYNIENIDWGTSMRPRYYSVNDLTMTIGAPTRDGYTFDGWCEGIDDCESPSMTFTINPETMELRNIELYAQWTSTEPITPPEEDPDEPATPEEFVCTSGRVLHVGNNDTMCLSTTPESRPAFGFGNGNNRYYLQMTEKPAGSNGIKMNKDSNKQLNIYYNNKVYNVHDGSVGND